MTMKSPRDIIMPDEIVSAATLIVQYCDGRTNCENCVFVDLSKPYGDRCGLIDLPDNWDLGMFRAKSRRSWRGEV